MKVGLFVTCIVNIMRPEIGWSAAQLLEHMGLKVHVPLTQSCCGQPNYNNGDIKNTKKLAKKMINEFENFDAIIIPSGSCGSTIIKDYPLLFTDNPKWYERSKNLAEKTFELCDFLYKNNASLPLKELHINKSYSYHDSCSGLRKLGIKDQPRKLLAQRIGLEYKPLEDSEACCGFGGTFSVDFDDVSGQIASKKVQDIKDASTDMILGGDLSCLIHIAGRLHRMGVDVEVRHVAEILAGNIQNAPLGGYNAKN
ncbi:MAG: (Fe-S)-binding protein [Niabella sp.]